MKCEEIFKKESCACRLSAASKQSQHNQFPPPQDVHRMLAGFYNRGWKVQKHQAGFEQVVKKPPPAL